MALDLSPASAAVQAQIDAISAATAPRDIVLLAKAAQEIAGPIAIQDIRAEGATQTGAVSASGAAHVADVSAQGAAQVAAIIAEGDRQTGRVTTEGDTQADRVQALGAARYADISRATAQVVALEPETYFLLTI